jgi:hypothetical protein
MESQSQASTDIQTPDLDVWFQDHQMPLSMRPHDSWNQNHGGRTTNYRRDYRDSITGEDFFENYLKGIHGKDNVFPVDREEQRYNHRGDVSLNHVGGPTEFEVKLERKGSETGRHAMEFGEYYSDYHGNVRDERAPGWFRSSKADIIVPVVPMSDGTVILYPYSIKAMRDFLAKISAKAARDGYNIKDEHGQYDRALILDSLESQIENSRHTLGPINTLPGGGYKRSRSICVPYEFLIKNHLMKPYVIHFDS